MDELKVSLIVTTYNWPQALEVSLQSALAQTRQPFEIIVADDGSGESTAQVVKKIQQSAPFDVIHSWHEDKGFRLAKSRNKAIAKARGNYVILIDGDIILEKHFISDHCSFARTNCFVQGTRVLLGKQVSEDIFSQGMESLHLFSKGIENRKNGIRSGLLAKIFSFRCTRLKGVKTCNFAFWRDNAIRINGFNEEFVGWGREDSEFTARLLNSGVVRQNVKFYALGYHLFHSMNTRDRLAINDSILHRTIVEKSMWCDKGMSHHFS